MSGVPQSPSLRDSDVVHVVAKRFTRIAEKMERHDYAFVQEELTSVMEILEWLGAEIMRRNGVNP